MTPHGSNETISSQISDLRLEISQSFHASIPRVDNSSVIIDGKISTNEYLESYFEPITEIIVFWEHNSVNLTVGLISPSTGWVALGIGSNQTRSNEMDKSNMIMGGATGNSHYAVDLYGTGGYSHGNDTENGGTDDILEASAKENSTHTIFEFRIPLNSSDTLDPPMQENDTVSMFFGVGTSDNIKSDHISHSYVPFYVFLRPKINTRRTILTLSIPSEIHQGETLKMSAILTDENYNPLVNMSIEFFVQTQFGPLIVDTVDTNSTGGANTTYRHPTLYGNFSFGVKFKEIITSVSGPSIVYMSSEVTQIVIIDQEKEEKIDLIRAVFGLIGLGVAGLSLLAVWTFYGVNALLILSFLFDRNPDKRTKE